MKPQISNVFQMVIDIPNSEIHINIKHKTSSIAVDNIKMQHIIP